MKAIEYHQQKYVILGRPFMGEGNQGIRREVWDVCCIEGRATWLVRKEIWVEIEACAERVGRRPLKQVERNQRCWGRVAATGSEEWWSWLALEGLGIQVKEFRTEPLWVLEQMCFLLSFHWLRRLVGIWGWWTRRAFKTIWGSSQQSQNTAATTLPTKSLFQPFTKAFLQGC